MRIDFDITNTEKGNFVTNCNAVIRNVGTATRQATELALWDIMSDSLEQVPVDTGTLITSAYMGISRRADLDKIDKTFSSNNTKKNYTFGGVIGYGEYRRSAEQMGMGAVEWLMPPTNRTNPKNGLQASAYAAKVHEDLDMLHNNGGKAKFLEDAVRNYAATKFARTLVEYWGTAITYSDLPATHPNNFVRRYMPKRSIWDDPRAKFKYKPSRVQGRERVSRGTDVQRGGDYKFKGASIP